MLAWLAPERRPRTPAQCEALTALGGGMAAPFVYCRMADDAAALAREVRHLNQADGRLLARRRAFQCRHQGCAGSLQGAVADAGARFGVAAQQAARRLAPTVHAASA